MSHFIYLQGDLKQKQKEKDLADEENFGNSSWGQFRASLWNILEYPWTSRLAQVNFNIRGWLPHPVFNKCIMPRGSLKVLYVIKIVMSAIKIMLSFVFI